MSETEAFMALNMIPKLGPVKVRRLLDAMESPERILSAKESELRQVEGVGPDVAASIRSWEAQVNLADELKLVEESGARIITMRSPEYPAALKEIHDPPIVLYILGGLLDRDRHAVGVVGTRKPSHYGTECAKKLSYQLANSGITIVSGLARGVDTYAHQGALAAKGRTVAVIGSGLLSIYPPENRELADKIATSGAVVTEFSMRVQPDRQTFPMRNRIISGCSFGVLVIEAGGRSGALISASQAGEQGRSVYAIPGRIDQPNAIGSNRLIQQGAKLVLSAGDILDDMGMLFAAPQTLTPSPAPAGLAGSETAIYEAIGDDETHIDEITLRSGLPTHVVSSTLLALEMKALVRQRPGGRFVKLR